MSARKLWVAALEAVMTGPASVLARGLERGAESSRARARRDRTRAERALQRELLRLARDLEGGRQRARLGARGVEQRVRVIQVREVDLAARAAQALDRLGHERVLHL